MSTSQAEFEAPAPSIAVQRQQSSSLFGVNVSNGCAITTIEARHKVPGDKPCDCRPRPSWLLSIVPSPAGAGSAAKQLNGTKFRDLYMGRMDRRPEILCADDLARATFTDVAAKQRRLSINHHGAVALTSCAAGCARTRDVRRAQMEQDTPTTMRPMDEIMKLLWCAKTVRLRG